ncbi:unnamed protein product [Hanseniaspora opuntiae]
MMSCGLDCKIIIWQFTKQTQTFNKVIELDNIHKNFIKSCEFDPTGKFFASISDDKTLKIYKYSFNTINNTFKFNLEVEISEPFKNSKNFKITYFNKMHWSPNGQFLIIPNGTSGQLENCCILIDRLNHWDYSFKLIGNAFPIELEDFMNVTNDDESVVVKAVNPKYNYKFLQKYGALGGKAENDDFGNENDNWKNMESIDEVQIYKQIPKILPNKFILNKNDSHLTSFDNAEIKGVESKSIDEKDKQQQPTKVETIPKPKVPEKQENKPQEFNENDLFELENLSRSSLKLPRLGYQTLVQGLKESDFPSEQKQVLFNDPRAMDELTSKLALNKMTMSSVIPDTDLHVQIFKNMNMSFEIRNNKERKMIYDPYNTGSLLETDLSNITKMECYLDGKLMWDYFCIENITHLVSINKDKLLMVLDDHQALILSSKSGMPLTSKVYFNEPIVEVKTFDYNKDSGEYHVLLIGINGTLSVLNERQTLVKEVSITNLLYDPLLEINNLSSKRVKCLKKIFSVKFDKEKHQIQLTLLNFKNLYCSEQEKYNSSLSKNHRTNKQFKMNEGSIIKELRRTNYTFGSNSLLSTERYLYCSRMGCWKLDS